MRIISGKYKYRNFIFLNKPAFSPVISSIRENIFNVLEHYVLWDQVNVLDLFAGSGILGLESLSRGAKFGYFGDLNEKCCQNILHNLKKWKNENHEVLNRSFLQTISNLKKRDIKLDLVFIDPPYQKSDLIYQSLNFLNKNSLLNKKSIVVVKSNQKLDSEKFVNFFIFKHKIYAKRHYIYFLINEKPKKMLNLNKNNNLLIISGPSGSGKSTIIKSLLKNQQLNLQFSISVTSRAPRKNEKDRVNYFFISNEQFEQEIKNDNFLEYAKFIDYYYGTSKSYVQRLVDQEKNIVFEIEIEGALQIIKKFPKTIWICIFPPSLEILKQRLIKRNTENETQIKKRLQKSVQELEIMRINNFSDRIFINENLEQTILDIEKYLMKKFKF